MPQNQGLQLGKVKMRAIDDAQLTHFSRTMQVETFTKVREDTKRSQRNVEAARKFVAR
jgi:hypothetical protein